MCKFTGCKNDITRWSRTGFCHEHRGAAVIWSDVMRRRGRPKLAVAVVLEASEKVRVFLDLEAALRKALPKLGLNKKNHYGYEVLVAAPGGLKV